MNFWDTSRGYHLANVITRYLPELAKSKEQYTKEFSDIVSMEEYVSRAIGNGERYVQHIVHSDGSVFLIMEK